VPQTSTLAAAIALALRFVWGHVRSVRVRTAWDVGVMLFLAATRIACTMLRS
jgi:hypothetical protein